MKAKKSLGQNFLVNDGIAQKIVASAGITVESGVLEIGPGMGALTGPLLERAGRVAAVELDPSLIPELALRFSASGRLSLIEGDVLKIALPELMEREFPSMPRIVVGNLPYYITTPIIMKLLEEPLAAERIVVTVQKEAAERLAADEGSRMSGAVTLAVRLFSEPKILFDVAPGSFRPAPKVWSSVVLFELLKTPKVTPKDMPLMRRIIRAAFSHRRKSAVNAISASLGVAKDQVAAAFSETGLPPMIRAERLTLTEYAAISDVLQKSRQEAHNPGDCAACGDK